MPISELGPGAIVRLPFPYTDGQTRQHRPALVVSAISGPNAPSLLWVLMITSAANRPWPGDVAILPLQESGLSAPSVIRTAKIATIEEARAEPRGRVTEGVLLAVRKQLAGRLGL
jgi:mRNA interferase MazF